MIELYGITPTLALIGITLALIYCLRKGDSRYPPGPWSLPLVGNLLQLALFGSLSRFAQFYRKRYGNVCILYDT